MAERPLTEDELSILEAYRQTFSDNAGQMVLDHLERLWLKREAPGAIAEMLGDFPHPYRGYALLGVQIAVGQIRAMVGQGDDALFERTVRLSDPTTEDDDER